MDIERILKMETTERDRLGMILSNRMDIVAMEKACISIDKWEELASDLLKWHEHLVTLGLPSVTHSYADDCLIQDSCKSFKTERCSKECKLYK